EQQQMSAQLSALARRRATCLRALAALLSLAGPSAAQPQVEEITIAQIRDAFRARTLTCHALVEHYIRRIDAYDKAGPAIKADVLVNPDAVRVADDLDRRFANGGPVGPLHCAPGIVKDNQETGELPTT